MAFTKVAPAGIGSTPGDGYRIGDSFLHSTGVEITNINATGILTAASLDISGGIDFDGHTELDNVNISGVSTFAGSIDANGDLDVDGHTNLDNVNIAGITTINGGKLAIGNVVPSKMLELNSGGVVASMHESTGGSYVEAQFKNSSRHYILGLRPDQSSAFCLLDNTSGSGGVLLKASGHTVTLDHDLDVDGHTELDNVNIAGVTTFAENINLSDKIITNCKGFNSGNEQARIVVKAGDNSAGGGLRIVEYYNDDTTLFSSEIANFYTTGIELKENVSITGVTTTNTLVIGDTSDTNTNTSDNRIRIGNNQDLQIFHGPNNSYIRNTTNSFNIEQYANATLDIFSNHDVRLRVNGGELAVDCSHNQGVDLYYDASTYSSPKLGTKSWGVYVNGQIGIGTATVRNNRAMQLTGESGSLFLITGHAPSICLNRDADDSSDGDRSFFGVSSVSNGFANGTAAGDTVIRGNSTGQIMFATGTSVRSRITANGCFVSSNIGLGVDDRWKIRSNTSNNELAFEYSTSSTLADSNIKMALFANGNIAMGPSNFTPGRHLHIKGPGQIKLESTDTGSWSGLEFLGSSGTNNYDAYMGVQDSDGLFFIDNNSNGIDFAIKYSTGNIGIGGETNPVALLTLNKGSVGSNNSYSTGEILRLEGYDSTNSKHGIGFGRYGGGANGYKPAAFIGAKEGIWSNYTNCHLVFATRISTNDDEPTERFRIRNDGDITIKSNDKGWVTIEHGYNGRGMKRHTREFNTGSSAATYNLIRVRRHYWGWGHYKFTVKRVYYSGIMDSVFYLNGHGRDDGSYNPSYAITEYQHNSHGSNVQSSGRITITSPSGSSPGDVYANYVDVQLQCPAYMYLIVEVEAAASNQDADTSNLGSDQYALFT